MTPALLGIGLLVYVVSTVYCLPLVYSEYATDGSHLWILCLLMSFVPIINTLYFVSHTFSYINFAIGEYNPLSDALNVRNNMNLKIHCKGCGTKFRKWEGIHEVTDTGIKTKCLKCENTENLDIMTDKEEFTGSSTLSLHSAVTFNRYLIVEQCRNQKVQKGL